MKAVAAADSSCSLPAQHRMLGCETTCVPRCARLQVYGGVVYMDFDKDHMQGHGCGIYQSLQPSLLPRLWLVYCDNPSDSGKVHSTVKQRWLAGDAAVVQGMQQAAQCAELGR